MLSDHSYYAAFMWLDVPYTQPDPITGEQTLVLFASPKQAVETVKADQGLDTEVTTMPAKELLPNVIPHASGISFVSHDKGLTYVPVGGLNLAEEFEAEGRTYVELDENDNVVTIVPKKKKDTDD